MINECCHFFVEDDEEGTILGQDTLKLCVCSECGIIRFLCTDQELVEAKNIGRYITPSDPGYREAQLKAMESRNNMN